MLDMTPEQVLLWLDISNFDGDPPIETDRSVVAGLAGIITLYGVTAASGVLLSLVENYPLMRNALVSLTDYTVPVVAVVTVALTLGHAAFAQASTRGDEFIHPRL